MADKKLNIKVGLKGAKKAEKGLGKVNNSMKSMAKTAVAAGAAFFGARAIISGLSAVIRLAGEQEQAEKKLEVALGRTSQALLNQATALQKVTTFGDEAIIGVQASLAAFLDSEDAIKKATEATLDISVAMGMDLKAAGDLVAKTLGSSTNAMSRYGIQVEGAVGSTERLESLTGNVAKLFGGQAKAQAETMAGAMQQASNAMGDAGEQIGSLLAPAVTNIAEWFGEAAKSVGDFFTGLTQTPLEKTIKELQELGASTEALMSLQKIQLERNLIKFNTELKNSKGFYTDINDLQSLITKNGKDTLRNVDLMANGESKRLKLQKEFDKLQKERIPMIRRTGEFKKMSVKEVNKLIDANTKLMNQNKQEEEDLISNLEYAEEMVIKLGEESVAHEKNLNILTNIKKSEAEILALKGMQSDIEPAPDPAPEAITAIQKYTAEQILVYNNLVAEKALRQQFIASHKDEALALGLITEEQHKQSKFLEGILDIGAFEDAFQGVNNSAKELLDVFNSLSDVEIVAFEDLLEVTGYDSIYEALGLPEPSEVETALDEITAVKSEFHSRMLDQTKGSYALQAEELDKSSKRFLAAGIEQNEVDKFVHEAKMEMNIKAGQQFTSTLASNLNTMTKAGVLTGKEAKRAAQLQATVDAIAGANAAFTAMAGIPVVGPALGYIAAASALAAGYANVRMIEKQQFAQGGIVPGQGTGDTVPAMLTPGEVILNKAQQENLVGGMGGGITINISAPLVDETVIDTIIPAIQKAQRMNLA